LCRGHDFIGAAIFPTAHGEKSCTESFVTRSRSSHPFV
jgi:hypothetical protein